MNSDETSIPRLYKVSYSDRVCDELRLLIEKAQEAGLGEEYLEAAKEIAARLSVYPQFGEPIIDLTHETGKIWIGTIGPLVVRYAIYEELRLVIVAVPIMAMPKGGSHAGSGPE